MALSFWLSMAIILTRNTVRPSAAPLPCFVSFRLAVCLDICQSILREVRRQRV